MLHAVYERVFDYFICSKSCLLLEKVTVFELRSFYNMILSCCVVVAMLLLTFAKVIFYSFLTLNGF